MATIRHADHTGDPHWNDVVCLRANHVIQSDAACLDNWPMRTVMTSGHEVQLLLESQCMECIPPIGMSSLLHINA